jgi:hypothetical protein
MQKTRRSPLFATLAILATLPILSFAQVPSPAFEKRLTTGKLGRRVTFYASTPETPLQRSATWRPGGLGLSV